MALSREYFRATEAALYSYPNLLQQIRERERYLEVLSSGDIMWGTHTQGGVMVAEQERAVMKKEQDKYLYLLKLKASHIESAVSTLPLEQKKLAELRYFKRASIYDILETLHISERAFYRHRRKIVEHCAPYVLGVFGY